MEYEDQVASVSRVTVRAAGRRLMVVVGIALLCLALGYAGGRAMDCSAGQSDGQCGLSSFLGLAGGVLAAGVAVLVGVVDAIIYVLKRRSPGGGAR